MARVVFAGVVRQHVGGVAELEVDVASYTELLRVLEVRFPGLVELIEGHRMTLALDGELISDPLWEPIEPDSEIHFIPRIGGGR